MTDVQNLKTHIDQGVHEATQYLDQLDKKLDEYDKQNKLPTTAASFLEEGVNTARSMVKQLRDNGEKLADKSQSASHEAMESASKSLHTMKESMHALQKTAQDETNGATDVWSLVGWHQGDKNASRLEEVVMSMQQRTTDTLEMAGEAMMRAGHGVQQAASQTTHGVEVMAGEAVRLAEKADQRLGVSGRVLGVVDGVAGCVKSLDKRLHVTETACKIDNKVTGGLGTRVVHKGLEMVQESIDYVSDTVAHAKHAASQSSAAQAVEQRVTSAGDAVACTACRQRPRRKR
ncbi:TPA: hypothetical protein N0F65_001354 [Lagenidium giganteum]|uniref:Methyl-accepting transducer domain-containing protein n=1 Tax=Lagenidium giganteum TaxID=4803 RepID=A0AAV2YVI5_9STRA|nr:TPA: hypothetical protein N0F65_001354 [Lagenidium giganteum]